MLAGERPFPGPTRGDLREQHLHTPAAPLAQVDTPLASLIEECLIKAPEARPTPANLLIGLERAGETAASEGLARLQEANRVETSRRAEKARRASEANSESKRRGALLTAADQGLKTLTDRLISTISVAAPMAEVRHAADGGAVIRLGEAELRISTAVPCGARPWGQPPRVALDTVAYSAIGAAVSPDRYGYEGREHSLWFCDAQHSGDYAWFETAFMLAPMTGQQSTRDPFAPVPGGEAAQAVGAGIAGFQAAWPFTRLEQDSLQDFIPRWAGWLADASERRLHRPGTMPEGTPEGRWRSN